jgi:hypothetical protein
VAKFRSLPGGSIRSEPAASAQPRPSFRVHRWLAGAIFGLALYGAVAIPGVALAAPAVSVDPTSGPIGTVVGVSPTACPAPAGAGSWTGLVKFAQGGNPELSFANFVIAADGSWGGQLAIPTGAVPGAAQLIAQCFDATHTVPTSVDYAPVNFLVTSAPPAATATPTPMSTLTPTPTLTVTPTPTPVHTVTPTPTPTEIGAGGGGGGSGGGGGNPGATPELDSLLLFGSGLAGLAGLARLRFLAARRKRGTGARQIRR